MTRSSAASVLDALDTNGRVVSASAMEMCERNGVQFPGTDGCRLAMSLPSPHVRLLAKGHWLATGFPLVQGRARSIMGLGLVPNLCGIPVHGQVLSDLADGEVDDFTPEKMQSLANMLRLRYAESPDPELASAILWAQRRRDAMLLDACARTATSRGWPMQDLVMAVLATSLLHGSNGLLEEIELCIRIAVPDVSLRDQLLQRLRSRTNVVPSASTVIRHRLTLTAAFYSLQARISEELFTAPGACVHWRTVDSSPQGGHDWVLHGARAMATSELEPALDAAHELCGPNVGGHRQRELVAYLEPLLHLQQGAPVAVGSGQASVRRKVHALVHSQRLQSQSWSSCVGLLNRTVSRTGDCGTEAGICRYRDRLASLFGDWVLPPPEPFAFDDAAPDAPDDPEAEVAFNFDDVAPDAPDDLEAEVAFNFEDAAPDAHVDSDVGVAFNFDQVAQDARIDLDAQDHPEGGVAFNFDDAAANAHDDSEDPPWPVHDDPHVVDFSPSVFVAGLLHVIDNLTGRLEGALALFTWWLELMKHVCRLLARRYSRERMQEKCFSEPPLSNLSRKFDGFQASVYKGRWGSVANALSKLLPLETLLRTGWSLQKYRGGGGVEQARGDDEARRLDVDKASEAIGSHMFWAYCHMLDFICSMLAELSRWAEACPCHWADFQVRGAERHGEARRICSKL